MSQSITLLRSRRFLPLFLTQFLGALNDNLLKNALVILITYVMADRHHENAQVLVTLAAGLFILPFFLFSATAGQLADKYEKSQFIRMIKIAEIMIMLAAAIGFMMQHIEFLLLALFAMGTHSAFFGPLKYSILPEHLAEDELIAGNALIEAGTFLAILLGTIIGGLLITIENGTTYVSALVVTIALLGYAICRFIPKTIPAAPHLHVHWNVFKETWSIISYSRTQKTVFLSIIGISWFWLVGATFLSQFPTYAKDALHSDSQIVTLFLTIFSVGIGVGSLICTKLMKGRIHGGYVPLGAMGMAAFTFLLYFVSLHVPGATAVEAPLITLSEFLNVGSHQLLLLCLFMIATSGGLYIVPLYAIMQARSEPSHRARVVAANNVMNALFMVTSVAGTLGMFALHFSVTEVFLTLAIINLPVAIATQQLIRRQKLHS